MAAMDKLNSFCVSSPPAWTSSAGMLPTPADFPFFNDCTAASTSLPRMGWSSSVSVWGQLSTDGSPLALQLYSSEQYSVHRFSICRSSVRHFPERSWTVVDSPVSQWSCLSFGMPSYCCSSSDFLQSNYTVLLSSFLWPFFMHLLMLLLTSLYFSDPSGSNLFFLSSLLLSHRSRISAVIQVFFF